MATPEKRAAVSQNASMASESPLPEIDLKSPELYINRDLSLLEFNQRVLEQSLDENVPLLERLRFLCISSTNLDEFFEVRVASLKQKIELGSVQAGPDNRTPQELISAIGERTQLLVADQYRILNDVLIPELGEKRIHFIKRQHWNTKQESWLSNYFKQDLLPLLSPLGLDPAHPFPRILNKSLNFIVALSGSDAFGRKREVALVQAPRALPRLIQLPAAECGGGPYDFVFLSSVIHAYIDELFPGMKAVGCYQFRVTRDSELLVDEEEVDDLLRAVEGELSSRRFSVAVRLEVVDTCPDEMVAFLKNRFSLANLDIYKVNGPVNLNRLQEVYDLVDRPDLKYFPFTPGLPPPLITGVDIFQAIRKQDLLLHHPFESFAPVVDFLRQAAADDKVLAIKQTLYRTGSDSAIVDALLKAARSGKEVTVVIELRARFDEEANIGLANRLQEAGAHVVYGLVGYKTHAKMLLVVRREGNQLRNYVHLGTGNYHSRTARLYTDYGFFTYDQAIAEDVAKVFLQLTSLGKVSRLQKLLQAPFTLFDTLLSLIDNEIENARALKPALIIIKVNSLVEPRLIKALYKASQAGVRVELIVRGICCLRPGLAGISDRIHVRSIVGRFLEHTRVFYFENGGDHKVYCSSADWMDRNFFRRVELAFPIESAVLRRRIIKELSDYLRDDTQAYEMLPDGTYKRIRREEGQTFSVQNALMEELSETI